MRSGSRPGERYGEAPPAMRKPPYLAERSALEVCDAIWRHVEGILVIS